MLRTMGTVLVVPKDGGSGSPGEPSPWFLQELFMRFNEPLKVPTIEEVVLRV